MLDRPKRFFASALCFLLLFSPVFGETTDTVKTDKKTLPSAPTNKEPPPLPSLESTALGQAVVERNIHAYRIEIGHLLNDPAEEFFRQIYSVTASGVSIFSLMELSNAHQTAQTKNKSGEFSKENLDLLFAIIPPLSKKNKQGLKAVELAQMRGNQAVWTALSKYNKVRSEVELDPNDTESLWNQNLSPIDLKETPLAKAILKEDPQAFYEAFTTLTSAPARELLSILHSRTKEGDSLFHLIAQVQTHQEEFAEQLKHFLQFVIPPQSFIGRSIEARTGLFSPDRLFSKSEPSFIDRFWLIAGINAFLLGPPLILHHLHTGNYGTGVIVTALSGFAIGRCYSTFKKLREQSKINQDLKKQ